MLCTWIVSVKEWNLKLGWLARVKFVYNMYMKKFWKHFGLKLGLHAVASNFPINFHKILILVKHTSLYLSYKNSIENMEIFCWPIKGCTLRRYKENWSDNVWSVNWNKSTLSLLICHRYAYTITFKFHLLDRKKPWSSLFKEMVKTLENAMPCF